MIRPILPRTKVGAEPVAGVDLGPPGTPPPKQGISPSWIIIGAIGTALLIDYARGYRYTKR